MKSPIKNLIKESVLGSLGNDELGLGITIRDLTDMPLSDPVWVKRGYGTRDEYGKKDDYAKKTPYEDISKRRNP